MSLQHLLYPLRTHCSFFSVINHTTCIIESSFYHPTSSYYFHVTHLPVTKTLLFNDSGHLYNSCNHEDQVFLQAIQSASLQASIPVTSQWNSTKNQHEVIFTVNQDDPSGILVLFQKMIRFWIAFESVIPHVRDQIDQELVDRLLFDDFRDKS